jgi:hypothetical protein
VGPPEGRACTRHICYALANERLWPNRILSVSLLRKVAFKLSEFDFIGLAVGVYRSKRRGRTVNDAATLRLKVRCIGSHWVSWVCQSNVSSKKSAASGRRDLSGSSK